MINKLFELAQKCWERDVTRGIRLTIYGDGSGHIDAIGTDDKVKATSQFNSPKGLLENLEILLPNKKDPVDAWLGK